MKEEYSAKEERLEEELFELYATIDSQEKESIDNLDQQSFDHQDELTSLKLQQGKDLENLKIVMQQEC